MRRQGLASIVVVVIAVAACAGRPGPGVAPAVPPGSGLVFIYLEPLPTEADGLRFDLEAVAAIGTDGAVQDVPLVTSAIESSPLRRQRLLARGAVPIGSYGRLELRLASARLSRPDGLDELRIPRPSSQAAVDFRVVEQEAVTLSVSLSRDNPVVRGTEFEPMFSAGISRTSELAPSATAVVTVDGPSVVTVFHKVTGEVFQVLRTAEGPRGVALDAERQIAYVGCAGADEVESFDLSRGARDRVFPALLGDEPSGLALSRDGETLVVANKGSDTVTVLDAPALTERFRVTVGREPVAVLLDPTDARAIVFTVEDDSLSLVDLARGVRVGSIPTERGPVFGAFDADATRLYVIHRDSPFVIAVDLQALRVTARAYVGMGARAIAVDTGTGRVYLARGNTHAIEIFDPSSLLPIETLDTGSDVAFLAADPESRQLLAAIDASQTVRVLRLNGGSMVAVAGLGGAPAWIDLAGRGRGGR